MIIQVKCWTLSPAVPVCTHLPVQISIRYAAAPVLSRHTAYANMPMHCSLEPPCDGGIIVWRTYACTIIALYSVRQICIHYACTAHSRVARFFYISNAYLAFDAHFVMCKQKYRAIFHFCFLFFFVLNGALFISTQNLCKVLFFPQGKVKG